MATRFIDKVAATTDITNTPGAAGCGVYNGALLIHDGTNVVAASGGGAPVSLTAGATLAPLTHAGRPLIANVAAGGAIVLPAATGTGNTYRIIIGTALVSADLTVTTAGTDLLKGSAIVGDSGDSSGALADLYVAGASDEQFLFDVSVGGGKVGDFATFTDIASGIWAVWAVIQAEPDPITPFASV